MRSGRATQLEMHVGNGLLVGSVSSLILASGADEKDKAELIAQGRAQIERQQAARLGLEVGGRLRVVDGEDESYTTADPEVKR
jgi:hypothetical protein